MRIRRRNGWSMIELLCVMAILSLLLGVSMTSFQSMRESRSAVSAQQILGSLFREASLYARMNNRPARLIIHNDPSDAERYMRFVGIELQEDGVADEPVWRPRSQGIFLPKNTKILSEYFLADEAAVESVQSPFPRTDGSGAQVAWLAFETDARGIWKQAGQQVVIGPSRVSGEPGKESSLLGGLLVTRSGLPLPLEAPFQPGSGN